MVGVGRFFLFIFCVAATVMAATTARAEESGSAKTSDVGVTGQAAPAFDVNAAVEAYLAKMPPAERARSNAYFEGGYWLQLWDFLSTVVLMWLLLRFRWSVRMRDFAERVTRLRPLQTAIYWVQFIVVLTVATFPLGVYEGYVREHKYGLSNQNFGSWIRDQAVVLGIASFWGAFSLCRYSDWCDASVKTGGCGELLLWWRSSRLSR